MSIFDILSGGSITNEIFNEFKFQLDNSFTLNNGTINRKEFLQVLFNKTTGRALKISIIYDDDEFIDKYKALADNTNIDWSHREYLKKILTINTLDEMYSLFKEMDLEVIRAGFNLKRFLDYAAQYKFTNHLDIEKLLCHHKDYFINEQLNITNELIFKLDSDHKLFDI